MRTTDSRYHPGPGIAAGAGHELLLRASQRQHTLALSLFRPHSVEWLDSTIPATGERSRARALNASMKTAVDPGYACVNGRRKKPDARRSVLYAETAGCRSADRKRPTLVRSEGQRRFAVSGSAINRRGSPTYADFSHAARLDRLSPDITARSSLIAARSCSFCNAIA